MARRPDCRTAHRLVALGSNPLSGWTVLRRLVKCIAKQLFGPYELNRVYFLDIKRGDRALPTGFDLRRIEFAQQVMESSDPIIRDHAWYVGDDAYAYGLWERGALVCMCVFWTVKRLRQHSIVTLGEGEAAMVDLITAADCRGRGYAPVVIRFAETELKRAGFERLYSWVWFSNSPSKRTFEKAGWSYVALVISITPIGYGRPLRIERRFHAKRPS